MTTRERTLASVLLVILLGIGVLTLLRFGYIRPVRNLEKQLADRQAEIDQRDLDIRTEKAYMRKIEELSPRLAQWKKLSLPEPTPPEPVGKQPGGPALAIAPTAEAYKAHLKEMQHQYQKVLEDLLTKARFKKPLRVFKPAEPDSRTAPQLDRNKPAYHLLSYSFEGETDLKGVVEFFRGLYQIPLLHQVKNFTVTTQRTSNNLDVKMTVEVLLVSGAEMAKERAGILPKFDDKQKQPQILASIGRNYEDIIKRNPFAPQSDPRPSTPEREPDTTPTRVTEDPDDVFSFVRLTMIAYSDYYDAWIARVLNPGNRGDSVLLIDKALPKDSRFMREKAEAEKNKNLASTLVEPVTRYTVKDKYKETLLEMQIVRIEPLRIIFQADGELYVLELNNDRSLKDALADPLDKDEIKRLGLSADRDEALKKVLLKEVKYRKDRDPEKKGARGYEAHFVNPDNKDEKVVLAVDMLPEEFDAPEKWVVKDRFGAELARMQVVRVDKDQAYFAVGKQFFRIKPEQGLQEAMAKPLSEAEVKTLKLSVEAAP